MVAVAHLIPNDPQEQASILAVLREHPELRAFIQQASARAEELFPGATIQLDTVRYDDWDPPVRMTVHIHEPWDSFAAKIDGYIHWLTRQPGFDGEVIAVLPQWYDPEFAE